MHITRISCIVKAMAKSITVRNVPDQTRNELAARAAKNGRSLQEYLRRELIAMAENPDMETVLARIRERKNTSRVRLPAEEIVAAIHEGRR